MVAHQLEEIIVLLIQNNNC